MKRCALKRKTPLKAYTRLKSETPLKPYSKKRAKAERERYSIFTDDMEHCIECKELGLEVLRDDIHEIFEGKDRQISMKYDLCIPLCRFHHEDPTTIAKWQKKGRQAFIKEYGEELFLKEFQTRKGEK